MKSKANVFHSFIILCGFFLSVYYPTQSLADDAAGQIVSLYGDVWISAGSSNPWQKITQAQNLYIGYTVKTGRLSGASLRMEDESLIKLSQQTEFVVEGVRVSSFWRKATSLISGLNQGIQSTYRLLSGKLWGRNNNRSLNSQIITTTATIGIRGTEYSVEAHDEFSSVTILEGVVQAENEQGQTIIHSGEQAITRAGQAPQKSTLVQTGEAVQWTILVPELIDLPVLLKTGLDNKLVIAEVYQAYQQSQYATALDLLSTPLQKNPQNTDLQVINAWVQIKAGESMDAYHQLKSVAAQHTDDVPVQEMTAFSAFLSGNLPEARSILEPLKQQKRLSDTGWVVYGYVHQAEYHLALAQQAYARALEINPENQVARVQLATLYFGSEQTERALNLVNKTLTMQPGFPAAINLKGFIQLAGNQTDAAISSWEEILKNDKASAETYFGLSLAYMRKGRIEEAMQSIATAVLLDPQRSLYLSYWGKMLHQIGRNDKALTVLDSAIRLDLQDPTPQLYKAIILRDLNRPGEAIQHIQAAVQLNDNRGVYRSRSLLDKDLAVQNVDLSRLFTQLGLSDWAHKKAMDSIKSDFSNVSGHVLNAGAYAQMGDRGYALANEALLARLMQPANINAFSSFNSYTSLYETPDSEFDLQLGAGNHQQRNLSLIAAGAVPEKQMAWSLAAVHDGSDGWRDTNGETFDNLSVIGKWQPSEKNNFLFTVSAFEFERLDDYSPRYEIDSVVDRFAKFELDSLQLELGLHHKLNQHHNWLAYLTWKDVDGMRDDISKHEEPINVLGDLLPTGEMSQLEFERPFTQLQLQGLLAANNHQLFYGLFAYTGKYNAETLSGDGVFEPDYSLLTVLNKNTSRHDLNVEYYSVYIQDSLKVNAEIQLDLAVYAEKMDNADAVSGGEWSQEETTLRLGLIWKVNSQNTLRLASFEYLLPFISARLDPTDIAGIPIYKNTHEGSLVSESDVVWDFEWEKGLVSTSYFKVEDSYTSAQPSGSVQLETTRKTKKQGIAINLNQMLGLRTGLNAGLANFKVEDESLPAIDRKETNLSLAITHVFDNSLSISAKQIMRDMDFDTGRTEGTVNITNVLLSYEFSHKSQQLEFEIINLFDEEFNWVTDEFTTTGIAPERMFTAKYRVSF